LVFPTDPDYCETFGHDLITGGVISPETLRDEQLLTTLEHMQDRNERQQTWLKTRISQAAPQTLVVPV
jgi:hypothetical protein